MNTALIKVNAAEIERCKRAQKWLLDYGTQLTGKKDDKEGRVLINFYIAEGVDGYEDAKKMLESYAQLSFPTLVKAALDNCQNTIVMCRDQIREELDK